MSALTITGQAYFTEEGLYGNRDDMPDDYEEWEFHNWIIIPTRHWTASMWEAIELANNDERYDLACHLQTGHDLRNGIYGVCSTCNLTASELGIKSLTLADLTELQEMEYYNA